jgi:hypothetical protein
LVIIYQNLLRFSKETWLAPNLQKICTLHKLLDEEIDKGDLEWISRHVLAFNSIEIELSDVDCNQLIALSWCELVLNDNFLALGINVVHRVKIGP